MLIQGLDGTRRVHAHPGTVGYTHTKAQSVASRVRIFSWSGRASTAPGAYTHTQAHAHAISLTLTHARAHTHTHKDEKEESI